MRRKTAFLTEERRRCERAARGSTVTDDDKRAASIAAHELILIGHEVHRYKAYLRRCARRPPLVPEHIAPLTPDIIAAAYDQASCQAAPLWKTTFFVHFSRKVAEAQGLPDAKQYTLRTVRSFVSRITQVARDIDNAYQIAAIQERRLSPVPLPPDFLPMARLLRDIARSRGRHVCDPDESSRRLQGLLAFEFTVQSALRRIPAVITDGLRRPGLDQGRKGSKRVRAVGATVTDFPAPTMSTDGLWIKYQGRTIRFSKGSALVAPCPFAGGAGNFIDFPMDHSRFQAPHDACPVSSKARSGRPAFLWSRTKRRKGTATESVRTDRAR